MPPLDPQLLSIDTNNIQRPPLVFWGYRKRLATLNGLNECSMPCTGHSYSQIPNESTLINSLQAKTFPRIFKELFLSSFSEHLELTTQYATQRTVAQKIQVTFSEEPKLKSLFPQIVVEIVHNRNDP